MDLGCEAVSGLRLDATCERSWKTATTHTIAVTPNANVGAVAGA
jgi:hypothetical protein